MAERRDDVSPPPGCRLSHYSETLGFNLVTP